MSENKVPRKSILSYQDSNEEEKTVILKSLLLYKSLTDNKVRELGLYNLGFKKFADHYDFMIYRQLKRHLAK